MKVLRYLGVTVTIIQLPQESPDRITLASGYFRYSLVLVGLVKSPLMLLSSLVGGIGVEWR